MKKTMVTVIVTALITGLFSYFITTMYLAKNLRTHHPDTVSSSIAGTQLFSANPYLIDSARHDIDNLQNIINSIRDSLQIPQTDSALETNVIAYTINAQDLIAALGVTGQSVKTTYSSVRVYLGYSMNPGRFRLFVVPVDTAKTHTNCGRDMFFNTVSNNSGMVYVDTTQSVGKFVLDLISPCPTTCDTSSRLVKDIKIRNCNCKRI